MIPLATLAAGAPIPHRIIRVIPANPGVEVEGWWHRFAELHPGWDMRTVVDPIDPMDWPLLGRWHHLATSGAQLAGMVRLEAVHRWGGWYMDSDMEPVRHLGPLQHPGRVVIGTEDGIHLTDAAFGAPPRHPAIRAVIDHVDQLYRDALGDTEGRLPGAQATGPLATTVVLGRRAAPPQGLGDPGDVVVLPREAFYPYSYTEKHRAGEDHASNPGVYAIHRWHFSWQGT